MDSRRLKYFVQIVDSGSITRAAAVTGIAQPALSQQLAVLENELKAFVAERGLKVGQLIHPLRYAVTGRTVGLGLYDALAILGRDRSLTRIKRAIAAAGGS